MSRQDRKGTRSGKISFNKGRTRKGTDGDPLHIASFCHFTAESVLETRMKLIHTPASSYMQTHPTYIRANISTHRCTFPAFKNRIGYHEKQVISVIDHFHTGTDIPGR